MEPAGTVSSADALQPEELLDNFLTIKFLVMYPRNRDLWMLTSKLTAESAEFETEVEQLIDMLQTVENKESFCNANKIMNINRNSIITDKRKISKIINCKILKPFIFICNKN